MNRKCFAPLFVLLAALFTAHAGHSEALVEMFSPQGFVKGVRQVMCRFTEPMVPFGDPGNLISSDTGAGNISAGGSGSLGEGPFDIECSEKGTGRWVDVRHWVYDFERTLPAGVRCRFSLKPGLRSLAGNEIAGQREFSFSTGGPMIDAAYPPDESPGIDEEQVFLLVLDGAANEESVLKYASFSIEGIKGRVGVSIVKGAEREAILGAAGPAIAAIAPWIRADSAQGSPAGEAADTLLLRCRQRFPSATDVSLVWGKGVSTENGVATEQDQVLSFTTREPFAAELRCERVNPRSGCIPILPVVLAFNAPVSKADADRIVMRGPGGRTWKPRVADAGLVLSVEFEGMEDPLQGIALGLENLRRYLRMATG